MTADERAQMLEEAAGLAMLMAADTRSVWVALGMQDVALALRKQPGWRAQTPAQGVQIPAAEAGRPAPT